MSTSTPATRRPTRPVATVAAPIGFLGAYLAAGPVSDALADRPLPLPTAPATDAVAYLAANPVAAAVLAGMQVVSVACFVGFVAAVAPRLRGSAPWAARLPLVGYVSAAAMVLSSVLSGIAVLVAPSGAAGTVDVLRQAGFYAGGVANVVTLGVFVLGASVLLGRAGALGRPIRVLGYVAGALAVAAVLSLAFYYASVLLPVGRVLAMVWTVAAGLRLARGR